MNDERDPRGRALSKEDAAYLVASGDFTVDELAEAQARVARGELDEGERQTREHAVSLTLSTREISLHLDIPMDAVQSLHVDGDLFAFSHDDELRYPTWQLTGDPARPLLPGLPALVRAFPTDWSPAGVLAFMTTPKSAARIDGVPATPIDWLLNGGDVDVLKGSIDSFLQS
jgi:hypothetical protein